MQSYCQRKNIDRSWHIVSNVEDSIVLNTLGGISSAIAVSSAASCDVSIFFPMAISIFMCVLAGFTNMLITKKDITKRVILAKFMTSILLAMLVFFVCVYFDLGWAECGFASGLLGWIGYPVFDAIESIYDALLGVFKKQIKNKFEEMLK